MASMLCKELQTEYKVRSMPVRKGDTVQVVRGSQKVEGEVIQVYRKKFVIYIEGISRIKQNGQSVPIGIHPSNVIIKKLKLDKNRLAKLKRKSQDNQPPKRTYADA